jgi:hypothetical protein
MCKNVGGEYSFYYKIWSFNATPKGTLRLQSKFGTRIRCGVGIDYSEGKLKTNTAYLCLTRE